MHDPCQRDLNRKRDLPCVVHLGFLVHLRELSYYSESGIERVRGLKLPIYRIMPGGGDVSRAGMDKLLLRRETLTHQ